MNLMKKGQNPPNKGGKSNQGKLTAGLAVAFVIVALVFVAVAFGSVALYGLLAIGTLIAAIYAGSAWTKSNITNRQVAIPRSAEELALERAWAEHYAKVGHTWRRSPEGNHPVELSSFSQKAMESKDSVALDEPVFGEWTISRKNHWWYFNKPTDAATIKEPKATFYLPIFLQIVAIGVIFIAQALQQPVLVIFALGLAAASAVTFYYRWANVNHFRVVVTLHHLVVIDFRAFPGARNIFPYELASLHIPVQISEAPTLALARMKVSAARAWKIAWLATDTIAGADAALHALGPFDDAPAIARLINLLREHSTNLIREEAEAKKIFATAFRKGLAEKGLQN